MDKVKHEIEAALIWLEEGKVERVKLHLGFALAHLGDEAAEQERGADGYDFTDPNDNPYILSGEELERAVTAARSR